MSEEKISLQEMCELFEVTPRTLRYYDYIELLIPEKRGRKRFYGQKEKARLKLIKRGRRFGFSLEEIRQWLELYDREDRNHAQTMRWLDMSKRQIAELEDRKREIQSAIDEMNALSEIAMKDLEKGSGS